MKTNAKDYVSIAQQFFTAYDAHDVDGMLALCADGALRTICAVWPRERRADPWWHRCYLARVSECRSEFPSQSDRADPCRGEHSRDPSRDEQAHTCQVPGVAKKGQDVQIPHCYILRFDTDFKITRLDAYWDNTVLNSIKASGV